MAVIHDLMSTWSGLLTFVAIFFTAFAIPGGVIYALHKEIKGQAELGADARHAGAKGR